MPFGFNCEYSDFEECVRANSDKDDPEAYCGWLKNETEDKCNEKCKLRTTNKEVKEMPQATTEIIKRFEFPLQVMKAYKKEKDGTTKYYVEAIASDTGIDYYMERMSENAIKKMVEQVKKGVIILPTHWDTFEIGKTVDGEAIEGNPFIENSKDAAADTGTDKLIALKVTIELDDKYPEAMSLYDEVEKGNPTKQLSVGGWLNPDNEDAAYWEKVEATITLPNGSQTTETYWIFVLDDLILDHIAITRAGHAANERTGFLSAISKSLQCDLNNKFEVIRTNFDSIRNFNKYRTKAKMFVEKPIEKSKNGGEKNKIEFGTITEFSTTTVELLKKDLVDALRSALISKSQDKEGNIMPNEEVKKTNTEETKTDSASVEKATQEVSTVAVDDEVKDTSKEKSKADETSKSNEDVSKSKEEIKTDKTEEVSKSTDRKEDVVTKQELDIQSLIEKSIQNVVNNTIKSIIEETLKTQITPLAEKVKSIENNIAGSKSIEGQDELIKSTNESPNIWAGSIFNKSIVDIVLAKKAEMQSKQE
jgi:hypothetical protein